jgi:hypothetical protein
MSYKKWIHNYAGAAFFLLSTSVHATSLVPKTQYAYGFGTWQVTKVKSAFTRVSTNTVGHILDNMGNRIKEDIKDSSEVLQRSIERSFDALNRLLQVNWTVQ